MQQNLQSDPPFLYVACMDSQGGKKSLSWFMDMTQHNINALLGSFSLNDDTLGFLSTEITVNPESEKVKRMPVR